jgi:hypothetical protein
VLGWDRYGFDEKRASTHYAEFVFLPLMGAAGRIVHSGAQNVDAQFFILMWDRYGFDKKHTGTRDAELVVLCRVRSAGHIVHSSESGP